MKKMAKKQLEKKREKNGREPITAIRNCGGYSLVSGHAELSGLDGPSIHADADELLSVAVARSVCCHFVVRL